MNYSNDQLQALRDIEDFLHDNDQRAYVLTGHAGTGKTTIVRHICETIHRHTPFDLRLSATTHKASKVLSKVLGDTVHTIHSLLGLRPAGVDKFGNQIFKASKTKDLWIRTVVIVDEASMIDQNLLQLIATKAKEEKAKILFVGDPYQLPPIKSRCAVFDNSLPTSKLSTIHRQYAQSPIVVEAEKYRAFLQNDKLPFPTLENNLHKGEGVHLLDKKAFMQKLMAEYNNFIEGDTVNTAVCTYTNKAAIHYNQMIRKRIHFMEPTLKPYYPGEVLVAAAPYLLQGKVAINNDASVRVIEDVTSTASSPLFATLPDVPTRQLKIHNGKSSLTVKVTTSPEKLEKAIKEMKDKALTAQRQLKNIPRSDSSAYFHADKQRKTAWATYYTFKDSFADLRSPYAGTTHKAQGSTYERVYIDLADIQRCTVASTRARLLYVALTRASDDVFICIN
jgi:exodeoxyribonuclease-5